MTTFGAELSGVALHPGTARGQLLVLDAPLSFWGGSDLETGEIVDERHPQRGQCMAGKILVMHSGRGSSSSSSVLAEQIRSGASPAAIVLSEADAIIVMGAIVAAELYEKNMPVIMLSRADLDSLAGGQHADITAPLDGDAVIRIVPSPELRPDPQPA
jgi:predicted aconitase with swiveling domain